MAQLPGYVDKGSVETGLSAFRPISAADDVGRAAQRFAGQLGELATAIDKRDAAITAQVEADNKHMESVRSQRVLNDLKVTTTERLNDAIVNMDPADPHFYEKWKLETDRVYTEAFSKLELKGQFADKVELQFRDQQGEFNLRAHSHVSQAQKKYVSDTMGAIIDGNAKGVISGLMTRDEALKQSGFALREMGLPPEGVALAESKARRMIDGAAAQHYMMQNPTKAMQEFRSQLAPQYKIGTEAAHPLHNKMLETAERYNLPPWLLPFVASRENSGLDPNLDMEKKLGKGFTAFGLFQMNNGDWAETGVPKTSDPGQQIEAAARRMSKIVGTMEANGIEVTPTNVYAFHFLGRAGGPQFLRYMRDNPNADAQTVYAQVAGEKTAALAFNGSNGALLVKGATVAQTMAAIDKRSREGMAITAKMLGAEKQMPDLSQPLTLGGQVLDGLTRRDAQTIYSKSLEGSRRETEQFMTKLAKERVESGDILAYNADDRKLINDVHKAEGLGHKIFAGDQGSYDKGMAATRRYGFASPDISAAASQMIESVDGRTKLKGYELARTAHNADPLRGLEHSQFNPEHRKKIEAYTAIVNSYGRDATPEQMQRAATIADKAYHLDTKGTQKDKDKVRDEADKRTFAELSGSLDAGTGWWSRNFYRYDGSVNPESLPSGVKASLERHYRTAFIREFAATSGDSAGVEAAKARAMQEVLRTVGTTTVMGHRNNMLFPVEKNLRAVDGTHQWVSRQAMQAIDADITAANRHKAVPLGRVDPKTVFLVGDSETASDIAAGRGPSYVVFYKNSKGEDDILTHRFRPSVEQLDSPASREAREADVRARETGADTRRLPSPITPGPEPKSSSRDRMERARGAVKQETEQDKIDALVRNKVPRDQAEKMVRNK